MSIGEYFLRRLGLAVFVLLGVLLVTFLVSRVVPGEPARLFLGPRASREALEEAREMLGLDDPLPVQFARYVFDTVRGDFGFSFRTRRPILQDLRVRLPATMELVVVSVALALIVGIPVGVSSAASQGGNFDRASRLITIAGISMPAFWLGLLLQLVFFLSLGWLPLGGRVARDVASAHPIEFITGFHLIDAAITGNWVALRSALIHIIMPAAALATYPISVAVRMTRASMLDVLCETYVDAARAAGLSERLIHFRLALKNAIVPTLTVMGLIFAYSITGAVVVEIIFTWPGIGTYMTDAILSNDIYVLFGVTVVVTIIYIFANLAVDLIQAAMDPRVRLGAGKEG